MPKKLLNFPIEIINHIDSYQKHFSEPIFTHALLQLVLDGFKWNGNPIDPSFQLKRTQRGHESAREAKAREEREHQERYEKLMEQLGFNSDGTRKETDD